MVRSPGTYRGASSSPGIVSQGAFSHKRGLPFANRRGTTGRAKVPESARVGGHSRDGAKRGRQRPVGLILVQIQMRRAVARIPRLPNVSNQFEMLRSGTIGRIDHRAVHTPELVHGAFQNP